MALRDHVTVNAKTVSFDDVIDSSGGAVSAPASATAVWHAPGACQSLWLSRSEVEAQWRRLDAALARKVTLSGATRVEVRAACQRIAATDAEAVARHALGEWLLAHSDRFDAVAMPMPPSIELPPGEVLFHARPVAAGRASPRMQVWVDIDVAGSFVRSVSMVYDVHAFRRAWVASHDSAPGLDLSAATLVAREVDVAAYASDLLRDVPSNARLRRTLIAGDVLTAGHVEVRPQVVRGSYVTVRSRVGRVAIDARGEALQDGKDGQDVWVRVTASTGPVRARVVADSVVELSHE